MATTFPYHTPQPLREALGRGVAGCTIGFVGGSTIYVGGDRLVGGGGGDGSGDGSGDGERVDTSGPAEGDSSLSSLRSFDVSSGDTATTPPSTSSSISLSSELCARGGCKSSIRTTTGSSAYDEL